MSTSSIDDLLAEQSSGAPLAQDQYAQEPQEIEELEMEPDEPQDDSEPEEEQEQEQGSDEQQPQEAPEIDEYGNEKERMSKGMKERLDRKERRHQKEIEQREREIQELRALLSQQGASPQIQQAAQDFEYDPNDDSSWQKQLGQFIRQEVSSMKEQEHHRQAQEQERAAQQEYDRRFIQGMSRFDDFSQTIGALPFEIDNAMTLATRSFDDPAAFLYAAAKRNPGELERISKLRDPYAKITEMGRLEERMRAQKTTTKAPRPIGRSTDDGHIPATKKAKESSIEELIAQSEKRKMNLMKSRQGRQTVMDNIDSFFSHLTLEGNDRQYLFDLSNQLKAIAHSINKNAPDCDHKKTAIEGLHLVLMYVDSALRKKDKYKI